MLRLTREVRFAINDSPDDQLSRAPSNSYAGYPTLTGFGQFLTLQVTLTGELDPAAGYLRNIKDVDQAVRARVIPQLASKRTSLFAQPPMILDELQRALAPTTVEQVRLMLSPFLSVSTTQSEKPMVRLSQKFEFSASHRLHSPALSDEENRKCFGKCNNPNGHGHNYELQVTLSGAPDRSGVLIDVPAFERIVGETVVNRFDHKNLNVETSEFKELIPSVENIAMVIYRLLRPRFESPRARLASVTVWETPKTWCEYSE